MTDFLAHLQKAAFTDLNELKNYNSDLTGWISPSFEEVFREKIQKLYEKLERTIIIIEVGTWKGLSAITMSNIAKKYNIPVKIICVDTWLGAPEFWTWGLNDSTRGISLLSKNGYPHVYYTFLKNIIDNNHSDVIVPFPISSNEAVEVFQYYKIKADIIYIDAAHEYDAVKNDIQRYWSILELNGIMFGDDYSDGWAGVKKAVDEMSLTFKIPIEVSDVVWCMHNTLLE